MTARGRRDVLDVLDGERDVPDARVFAGAFGSALAAVGARNFASSSRALPSEVRMTAPVPEPDDAVHPPSLDRHLDPEAEFGEERDGGRDVVDNDADLARQPQRAERQSCRG